VDRNAGSVSDSDYVPGGSEISRSRHQNHYGSAQASVNRVNHPGKCQDARCGGLRVSVRRGLNQTTSLGVETTSFPLLRWRCQNMNCDSSRSLALRTLGWYGGVARLPRRYRSS